MPVKTVRLYTLSLVIFDALAILIAFTLAYILRVQLDTRPLVTQISAVEFFGTFATLLPFFIVTFWSLGLYSTRVYQKRLTEFSKLIIGSFIGILLIISYSYAVDEPIFPARLVPVYAGAGTFILLLLGREILRFIRDLLYYAGVGVQRVMVIGSGDATKDIVNNLNHTSSSGYNVVATVSSRQHGDGAQHFRSLEQGLSSLEELKIDTIIQTELHEDSERNQAIMNAAQERHIQYCFIPGEAEFYSGKNQIDVFLGYPIISVYRTPLTGWGEVTKRVFDVVFVVITSPVWLILIALLTCLQLLFNPGPIFYRSNRLTKHGKSFGLLKFRSMDARYGKKDALAEFAEMKRPDLVEEYQRDFKVKSDPRITRFGDFLRKSTLDEFPQLFNVLTGDISLVGPRPIPAQELKAKFTRRRGALLHEVRGGMTGLWQVSGRSDISTERRIELELYYVQNWSFWLDIKILLKTILVVLRRAGAR